MIVLKSPLLWTSVLWFFAAIAAGVGIFSDDRTVLNQPVWLKPMKFFISVIVYQVTAYFILQPLKRVWNKARLTERLIVLSMFMELAMIVLQASRGITSHFNNSDDLNRAVYGIMAVFAYLQIPIGIALYRAVRRHSDVYSSPALGLGTQLGLLTFILGCIQAGIFAGGTGHSVGGPAGSPGLPLLTWSTVYGDHRVAHFFGLHGLQVFMGLGAYLKNSPNYKGLLKMSFALYGSYVIGVWIQALLGLPWLNL